MSQIYLDIFIFIGVSLLLRGVIRLRRVYEFPTLMSFIFLSFIAPQAISLVNNPGIVSDDAVQSVLIMSCLCLTMCLLGFALKPNLSVLNKFVYAADDRKLFDAGVVLSSIGLASVVLLQSIDIQTADNSNWTGPATIIYFFGNLRHAGFAILLNLAIRKWNLRHLMGLVLSLMPVLYMVLIAGRRTSTFIFLITIGLTLFYTKKLLPTRWIVLLAVVACAYLIPLLGALRGDFWTLLLSGQFGEIDFSSGIDRILLSGDVLELRNAAMSIETVNSTQAFGYGRGLWNDIVFQYVPGQLVGYEFKDSLSFENTLTADIKALYGVSFSLGSTPTGIGDSYVELGFAGCFIFGAIAYLFRHLWTASFHYSSIYAQILYIGLIGPALIGVTHGVGIFFQHAIIQYICLWSVWKYSHIPRAYPSHASQRQSLPTNALVR